MMFAGAAAFNADVSSWDVSHVTDLSGMFSFAHSFNRDVSGWHLAQGANTVGGPACPTCHYDAMTLLGGAGHGARGPAGAVNLSADVHADSGLATAGAFLLVAGFAAYVTVSMRTQTGEGRSFV